MRYDGPADPRKFVGMSYEFFGQRWLLADAEPITPGSTYFRCTFRQAVEEPDVRENEGGYQGGAGGERQSGASGPGGPGGGAEVPSQTARPGQVGEPHSGRVESCVDWRNMQDHLRAGRVEGSDVDWRNVARGSTVALEYLGDERWKIVSDAPKGAAPPAPRRGDRSAAQEQPPGPAPERAEVRGEKDLEKYFDSMSQLHRSRRPGRWVALFVGLAAGALATGFATEALHARLPATANPCLLFGRGP